MGEEARGIPLVEFLAEIVTDVAARAFASSILGKPSLALFDGFLFGERLEFRPRNVAQVTHEVHRLVITDQHVHHAASVFCFLLQAHEQIHRVPGIRAAVEDIADDDEVGSIA